MATPIKWGELLAEDFLKALLLCQRKRANVCRYGIFIKSKQFWIVFIKKFENIQIDIQFADRTKKNLAVSLQNDEDLKFPQSFT